MKKILCLIILLIPIFAYAEQCTDIEYAELKDMSQASFDKEYCKVTLIMESNINYLMAMDTKKAWKDVDSCTKLTDRMKRIYESKFGETPKICTEKSEKVWPDRIEE
jgi:hypothetical protein